MVVPTFTVEPSKTFVFGDDGTFTWHDDQSDSETDMVFELMPAEAE